MDSTRMCSYNYRPNITWLDREIVRYLSFMLQIFTSPYEWQEQFYSFFPLCPIWVSVQGYK